MGRPGAFAERGSNFIVQNCDLFISIGSRLPFMVTGYNSKDFARNAIRVTVDIDSNEVEKNSLDFYASVKSLYLQDRRKRIANSDETIETLNDSDWEEIESD